MRNWMVALGLLMTAAILACCVQEQQTTTTTTSTTYTEQTTATTLAIEGYYTCSDSDGGLNATKKGVLKEEYREAMRQIASEILTYYDSCIDNDTVLEYYCNGSEKTMYEGSNCTKGIICGRCNGTMRKTSVDCQKGYVCIDGACVDTSAEKKPNELECDGDQECASGHCTLNYNYTHIQYPKSKICCDEGECGFRGRCYENNRPLWMCSCKDSQLVACTTTTSMWN
jgi:hypothetical protein